MKTKRTTDGEAPQRRAAVPAFVRRRRRERRGNRRRRWRRVGGRRRRPGRRGHRAVRPRRSRGGQRRGESGSGSTGGVARRHSDRARLGSSRDVLACDDVRDRGESEPAVETCSEVDGDGADGIGSVERPDGSVERPDGSVERPDGSVDDAAALVRGTRAYQYAEGRGGVGYYDVDAEAIADAADGTEDEAVVQVVRLGYVHADRETVDDERVSAFLDSYGTQTAEANDGSSSFVDPAVQ